MRTGILLLAITLTALSGVGYFLVQTTRGQDILLPRLLEAAMSHGDMNLDETGLNVFICGTSSPIPDPNRAQACTGILTKDHFFIIDAGAGSTKNLLLGKLPLHRLQGILLTHFHSDHIAAIPDINLNSWVQGRPGSLAIMGPEGVDTVVAGMNQAYRLDHRYRVAHHGADMLPPAYGELTARTISAGVILDDRGLKITAFVTHHDPVRPATGYRFDYEGRSVVLTGDTIVTDTLTSASTGADLLLADALSLDLITSMEKTAAGLQLDRTARIMRDIQSYHADTRSIASLTKAANIRLTAINHMVPPTRNFLMAAIFRRDLPDNILLADDRMWFTLPAGRDDILVANP